MDVKATGGFIVPWHLFGGPVLERGPLADWPVPLLAMVRKNTTEPADSGARRPHPAVTVHRIDGALRWTTSAREGNRNQRLFRGSCLLRDVAAQGLIGDADAQARLVEAGRTLGLDEAEARKTIASAWRYRPR